MKYIFIPLFLSLFLVANDDIEKIQEELDSISQTLSNDVNIWKSYTNYNLYLDLKHKLDEIDSKIESGDSSKTLLNSKDILKKQLQIFGDLQSPFDKLVELPKLEQPKKINNPFDIFTSFSHMNQNLKHLQEYLSRIDEVERVLELLKRKRELMVALSQISTSSIQGKIEAVDRDIEVFENLLSSIKNTAEIYRNRIDEVNSEIEREILAHIANLLHIAVTILIIIAISFGLKYLSSRYLEDNQRVYMVNKAINLLTISITGIIIAFIYVDNIEYLVTILGFASAGLAIAMKDGFMSMFAWFVIIFGGSIKVGDRIKVVMNGAEYVGDVLDISFLRITLQEDVTLTTFEVNRRAGRIIFVPNNYIFTNLIANYSHQTLRTVWDGIDIVITFDSNHKKAMHIMKEIAKTYSQGYTDMTRKQLNRLRDRYNLRNTNVEPRMFSFISEYGIKLSVWYLTNAYATLNLRSNISSKIVDSFNEADDITIAYPTQNVNFRDFTKLEKK